MKLRAIGGCRAGTIQDYDFAAGQAALAAGFAERLEAPAPRSAIADAGHPHAVVDARTSPRPTLKKKTRA